MRHPSYSNWPDEYHDPSWFTHDRWGLFIHFGLFSLAARHEWLMTTEQITPEVYQQYFDHFNPDKLAISTWLDEAVQAGMKYVVLTTKHHEGFALWDSDLTDYKVTNTPFKQDIVRIYVDEARKRGLKVGFYHSLIDWHHPDFTLDGLHPLRNQKEARELMDKRDMTVYRTYLKGQITELLTRYGKIDYMWYDFSYPHRDWGWSKGKGEKDWDGYGIETLTRQLQPHILINDRLDIKRGIRTPEQYQPEQPIIENGKPVLWEACQTLNESWGYDRYNSNWKSVDQILKMLIDTVSKGGNLLLNIGPNARGLIDQPSQARLDGVKEWMRYHERSIIGCGPSQFSDPLDCRLTQKDDRLYVHVFSWPFRHIHMKGIKEHVRYAQFLHDGSEVFFETFDPNQVITSTETTIGPDDIVLDLPVVQPKVTVPVIEIFLK
ncbi:alpha-L-fucosidase [Halolactibacillus miurensis]|uniref:alpha-L-fucosidase n=1 Tax=Halolactibacillus miurensis TaxID=306541 RepID=A0A1I6P1N2_9BACI|nr:MULTISPECIES: alpha-L-fucosidase [Halolactibacillus]GEM03181.1 alpha-L-fucosidase [Halolactibacillus miurensis]SFS34109.1 alpha-L-fucosidase [Halolactibacillus miurensis]